jgi:hypothetical protein
MIEILCKVPVFFKPFLILYLIKLECVIFLIIWVGMRTHCVFAIIVCGHCVSAIIYEQYGHTVSIYSNKLNV